MREKLLALLGAAAFATLASAQVTLPRDYNLAYSGSKTNVYYWPASSPSWPGVAMQTATGSDGRTYRVYKVPEGTTGIIFNTNGDADKTKNLTYTGAYVMDDNGATSLAVSFTGDPQPGPGPDPDPDPDPNPDPDPDPDPTPHPDPVPGGSYYWTNKDNHLGTNRTVNVTGHPASNAMSNWTAEDQVAQGVARDVCQAIRGKHERPIIDSYAVYASYDANNLYIGVQYVYTIWDLYGDGKLPGECRPYNMDGRLMLAFDLDPSVSHNGVMADGNTIWDSDGKYNMFDNGADAFFLCSTKPGVGTPGFFKPNASGKISYSDPTSCISNHGVRYGYANGLLSHITQIWGQKDFEYDPEALKGDTGFVDLIGETDRSSHTFYEFTFPLSTLGVTESYIKNNGIGFIVIDTYGQGAVGSTPYDPTCFDNADVAYSKDKSTSKEKEDTDVFTCDFIRVGKAKTSSVAEIEIPAQPEAEPVYYNLQGQRVANPAPGRIYIRRTGDKAEKVRL